MVVVEENEDDEKLVEGGEGRKGGEKAEED